MEKPRIAKMQNWVLRAGLIWLTVCVLMTGAAGWSFGSGNTAKQVLFMFGFPLITVGAAVIIPFIEHAIDRGAYFMALMLIPAWGICTVGEGFGHLMIVASQRDSSIAQASMSQTNYEAAKKAADEQEAKLKFLTGRLAELRAANEWVASVNADGLKSMLASANLAIEQEAARGGCKAKCLTLTKERDELGRRIAVADEMNRIPTMMEAAERGVASARAQLAGAKMGHSDAGSQTSVTAKLLNASLRPGDDQKEQAGIILELIFVACFLLGPMTLIALGVKNFDKPKHQRSWTRLMSFIGRAKAWLKSEPYTEPLRFKDGKLEVVQRIEDQRGVTALSETIARIIRQNHGQIAHG